MARRARWIVSAAQLRAGGVTREVVWGAKRAGMLTPLFHAVYLVGRATPTPQELLRAALLAAGRGAVLSHRTAAALWGLMTWDGDIEVIVPSRRRRQRGLVPRTRQLDRRDVTTRHGLLVTTLARTLVDLASVADAATVERAVHEAEWRKLLRVEAVDASIARAGRPKGIAALERSLLRRRPLRGELKSGLERRFHRFLAKHGFPPTEHNVLFELNDGEHATIDVLFREPWLAIEVDGNPHESIRNTSGDRRRDRRLRAEHDLPTIRVTETDLDERPDELAADLWSALRQRRSSSGSP